MDKRARSREVSSRGRRCRSRSLSAYRSRLRGRERGGRSSSASRFSRGRSRCGRSRSSDRYRSQRGSSRSRRAWSRSSDRYRSRRDRSRRGRSRSFGRYRSRRERERSHACRGVRRGRSRSHALPNRSRDRSRSSVRLPASPARLRSVEAGRLARRGPQEGVEAFVSQPPVAWSSGGRPSCSGGASIAALPSVFAGACQVLHGLVWLLFPGSTWSLGGCDRFCSSVGGCRVPVFACCWGSHFLCCDCDACWGWRFACCSRCWSWRVWWPAASGHVPLSRALQSVVWWWVRWTCLERSRGGSPSSVSSSRRRGRRCRSSTDSSVDDRADTSPSCKGWAWPVWSVSSSASTFGCGGCWQLLYLRGVSPGVGWLGRRFQLPMASSRRSGSSPVLLVSGFWSGFFHPLLGAPLLGRLSVVPAAGLTAVSLAHGLAFGGLPCGGGLPRGYWWLPVFLSFGRGGRLLLIYPGLF